MGCRVGLCILAAAPLYGLHHVVCSAAYGTVGYVVLSGRDCVVFACALTVVQNSQARLYIHQSCAERGHLAGYLQQGKRRTAAVACTGCRVLPAKTRPACLAVA